MTISRDHLFRASYWAALGSAVAILLSIAVSQILLGLALVLLLFSRAKLRLPRVWLPLALFVLGTLISLAFSPEPALGWPPLRKMFLFTLLLVLFSTMREAVSAGRVVLALCAVGTGVAIWGIVQFAGDVERAAALHQNFYQFYMPRRISGAVSHWMTFAGQEMIVLLMLTAFLLFGPKRKGFWWWVACALLLAVAELLNETRSVWLALGIAGIVLLWNWKRWVAVAAPVTILALLWFSPGPVHERFVSIFKPKKDLDSNEFRYIMDRTGWEIIKAHPLVGLGPEELKYHMKEWIPRDIDRPLPSGFYEHLHNIYLQYAAERGIPTMLMMLWMLLMILYDWTRVARRLAAGRSNERFLLLGGIASVIGIMVGGLFEHNLGNSGVLTAFLAIVAVGYVAMESAQEKISSTGRESGGANTSGIESPGR